MMTALRRFSARLACPRRTCAHLSVLLWAGLIVALHQLELVSVKHCHGWSCQMAC